MTASCVYEGWVRHRRTGAVRHEFRYRLFLPYLDMDEIDDVLARTRLWSARRPAPACFRRQDFLGDPDLPLADAVRAVVEEQTGVRPDGPVRMLGHLRYLGHVFNPITLYFCFEGGRDRLGAVAAEVTNTPWGERHAYAIAGDGPVLRGRLEKALHVSPFMPMDQCYELSVSEPGDTLVAHAASARAGERTFDATLSLRRVPLHDGTLDRLFLRHPAMTLKILAGIYFESLRLKTKGAAVHRHPTRGAA